MSDYIFVFQTDTPLHERHAAFQATLLFAQVVQKIALHVTVLNRHASARTAHLLFRGAPVQIHSLLWTVLLGTIGCTHG